MDQGTVTVSGLQYYDIDQIFDCGQCFRFTRDSAGAWTGVACRALLTLRQKDPQTLTICAEGAGGGMTQAAFETTFARFLGLQEDYGAIRSDIAARFPGDATLQAAMAYGQGIRILKQEPWEALCSFIISQNNNIPRIRKIIEAICARYGDPVGSRFAFPCPERLLSAGEQALRACGAGFRAGYLLDAAEKVASGEIDLEALRTLSTEQALARLTAIKGVGPKVAYCTLLFGLEKFDAFPVDVWMKKMIDEQYGGKLAPESLGPYAGVAQQYLFYYSRYKQKREEAKKTG